MPVAAVPRAWADAAVRREIGLLCMLKSWGKQCWIETEVGNEARIGIALELVAGFGADEIAVVAGSEMVVEVGRVAVVVIGAVGMGVEWFDGSDMASAAAADVAAAETLVSAGMYTAVMVTAVK